ncbi:MAG: 23S rRNA (uracil(1939)-C(5))-methyltransferase RlmD [Burkholderiaceae bacterium]
MSRRTLGPPKPGRLLEDLAIESVDLEGQGVAHFEGKVVFVAGALTGERLSAHVLRERPSYIKAQIASIHLESPDRRQPPCRHYGVCGGCSMQHATDTAQLAYKQRVLEDNLWHLGRINGYEQLGPLRGPSFGYRSRARLSARWVDKKGGLLLGFRERAGRYVTAMDHCPVLRPEASRLLPSLKDCLQGLSIARQIPQVELAVSDDGFMVWVIRVMQPPSAEDLQRLAAFEQDHAAYLSLWLQTKGPETAAPLAEFLAEGSCNEPRSSKANPGLWLSLPEFGLRMPFSPVDFTQVNFAINRRLVHKAVQLLDAQPDDRLVDFFCGLGNFSFALARQAAHVLGIEGSQPLVAKAQANAALLKLAEKTSFQVSNLFELDQGWLEGLGRIDRALIDPPREGAQALSQALAEQSLEGCGPQRLVMVSCNPATLARDAAILVHKGRWQLTKAGIANMFPQTAHVESIAVFDRL